MVTEEAIKLIYKRTNDCFDLKSGAYAVSTRWHSSRNGNNDAKDSRECLPFVTHFTPSSQRKCVSATAAKIGNVFVSGIYVITACHFPCLCVRQLAFQEKGPDGGKNLVDENSVASLSYQCQVCFFLLAFAHFFHTARFYWDGQPYLFCSFFIATEKGN